jgi:hypothetical protein
VGYKAATRTACLLAQCVKDVYRQLILKGTLPTCQQTHFERKKNSFPFILAILTPPFFIAHPFAILTPFRCLTLSFLFFIPFTLPFIPHFFFLTFSIHKIVAFHHNTTYTMFLPFSLLWDAVSI